MNNANSARLKKIISNFHKARVLVVGDLMLDEFIWGKVSRISPEAPVPVVLVNSESFMPGGSANVANNIRALGGRVSVVGLIGDDANGHRLMDSLRDKGIETDGIITDAERPTTLKTRIIAHSQQVVRIDKEKASPIPEHILKQVLNYIKDKIDSFDAIIIEDYGKGVIVPRLLKEVVALAKKHKRIVNVDPKEEHFSYYKGITCMTPNTNEASRAVGFEIKDDATLKRAGERLLKKLNSKAVLITLGEHGMCLFENHNKGMMHIPTVAKEVFDVSGAGDTTIGAFTLALAAKASFKDAAYLSNYAAGIVVGKVGVAVTTKDELMKAVR